MEKRTNNRRLVVQGSRPTRSRHSVVRVENSLERPRSGLGSQYDFGTEITPDPRAFWNPLAQDRIAVDLFYRDWSAQKIVAIPVADKLREGWTYDNMDQKDSDRLIETQEELGTLIAFKQAGYIERLIGGAIIFMGIADNAESPAQAVDLDTLQPGCLKFLNVIPRTRVTQVDRQTDPLKADYGKPQHYWINGQQVHVSRLIVFSGQPLLDAQDGIIMPMGYSRSDGFGNSVLIPIYDDLTRATGSRQAAMQLIQRASIIIASMDMANAAGTNVGERQIEEMRNIVNQINLFRGAVLDRTPGDMAPPITTLNPSFGSVPELVMSFMQVLSAASDIPATRFLGQAPGGLNATGESDLENYYGRLASDQQQTLKPQLKKLLKVMGRSVFGAAFSTIALDILFPPLWSMSELEASQVRTADVGNVVNLVNAGLLNDANALEELKQREAIIVDASAEDVPERPPAGEPVENPNEVLAGALATMRGGDDNGDPAAV